MSQGGKSALGRMVVLITEIETGSEVGLGGKIVLVLVSNTVFEVAAA